jgi:hypothetical protein
MNLTTKQRHEHELSVLRREINRLKAARLRDRELATVLAALRYWQWQTLPDMGSLNDAQRESDILDIATNGNILDRLDAAEIDALCERLNFGGAS